MKGPIPTAAAAGTHVENRDVIWAKLQATPEGSFFRPEDIIGEDTDLRVDFDALLGHDYHHVVDDLYTAVIETSHLRRWPRLQLVIKSYTSITGETIVPTGDRASYDLKLRPWETLNGMRFYTDGGDAIIKNGRMKIRFIPAPEWLRKDDQTSVLLRVFHDQPEKNLHETCTRALREGGFTKKDLLKVCDLADQVSDDHFSDTEVKKTDRIIDPAFISTGIRAWLDERAKTQKDNKAVDSNV
jgi:hypothetical protein